MKNITLVAKVAELQEYQKMNSNQELPLVLRFTDFEMSLLEKDKNFKSSNIGLLYYHYASPISEDKNHYFFLNEETLADFIENRKISISEFITNEGDIKYVDYISRSHSIDFGGRVVFRKEKRTKNNNQAGYSKRKNRLKITSSEWKMTSGSISLPMLVSSPPNYDSEELFSLCLETIYSQNKKTLEEGYQKKI